MQSRSQNIKSLADTIFDVVVIGGGITGAGIAIQAAKRGWKVLIIDKGDFASGTSSKSAKMIHGGLRYLENFEFKLVGEALHEREHLLEEYPHLVKPQAFFMPIYNSRIKMMKIGIGLSSYELLAGKTILPKYQKLSVSDIKKRYPDIETKKLTGGYLYYDAKTNDAQLVVETIQRAVELGGVAINYFELKSIESVGSQVKSVGCQDVLTGQKYQIQSKVFVSATGVWTDELMSRAKTSENKKYMLPSKGIHLVVPASMLPAEDVLVLPTSNNDGRMIWCMPWQDDLNIIGTTDTEYDDDLDEIMIEEDEITYLLNSVNAHLKSNSIKREDVLGTFVGLRPILNDDDDVHKESKQRSRDYQVWWNYDNMLTIAGGKLTSFLSMGENCIKEITKKYSLAQSDVQLSSLEYSKHALSRLVDVYGLRNASLIAQIAQEDESYLDTLEGTSYTIAELIFFVRYQYAVTVEDITERRTTLAYQMKQVPENIISKIKEILLKELS